MPGRQTSLHQQQQQQQKQQQRERLRRRAVAAAAASSNESNNDQSGEWVELVRRPDLTHNGETPSCRMLEEIASQVFRIQQEPSSSPESSSTSSSSNNHNQAFASLVFQRVLARHPQFGSEAVDARQQESSAKSKKNKKKKKKKGKSSESQASSNNDKATNDDVTVIHAANNDSKPPAGSVAGSTQGSSPTANESPFFDFLANTRRNDAAKAEGATADDVAKARIDDDGLWELILSRLNKDLQSSSPAEASASLGKSNGRSKKGKSGNSAAQQQVDGFGVTHDLVEAAVNAIQCRTCRHGVDRAFANLKKNDRLLAILPANLQPHKVIPDASKSQEELEKALLEDSLHPHVVSSKAAAATDVDVDRAFDYVAMEEGNLEPYLPIPILKERKPDPLLAFRYQPLPSDTSKAAAENSTTPSWQLVRTDGNPLTQDNLFDIMFNYILCRGVSPTDLLRRNHDVNDDNGALRQPSIPRPTEESNNAAFSAIRQFIDQWNTHVRSVFDQWRQTFADLGPELVSAIKAATASENASNPQEVDFLAYPRLQEVDDRICRIMQECVDLLVQLTILWNMGLMSIHHVQQQLAERKLLHSMITTCWNCWLQGLRRCLAEVLEYEKASCGGVDRMGNLQPAFMNPQIRTAHLKSVHGKMAVTRRVVNQLEHCLLRHAVPVGFWGVNNAVDDDGESEEDDEAVSEEAGKTHTSLVAKLAFLAIYRDVVTSPDTNQVTAPQNLAPVIPLRYKDAAQTDATDVAAIRAIKSDGSWHSVLQEIAVACMGTITRSNLSELARAHGKRRLRVKTCLLGHIQFLNAHNEKNHLRDEKRKRLDDLELQIHSAWKDEDDVDRQSELSLIQEWDQAVAVPGFWFRQDLVGMVRSTADEDGKKLLPNSPVDKLIYDCWIELIASFPETSKIEDNGYVSPQLWQRFPIPPLLMSASIVPLLPKNRFGPNGVRQHRLLRTVDRWNFDQHTDNKAIHGNDTSKAWCGCWGGVPSAQTRATCILVALLYHWMTAISGDWHAQQAQKELVSLEERAMLAEQELLSLISTNGGKATGNAKNMAASSQTTTAATINNSKQSKKQRKKAAKQQQLQQQIPAGGEEAATAKSEEPADVSVTDTATATTSSDGGSKEEHVDATVHDTELPLALEDTPDKEVEAQQNAEPNGLAACEGDGQEIQQQAKKSVLETASPLAAQDEEDGGDGIDAVETEIRIWHSDFSLASARDFLVGRLASVLSEASEPNATKD